MKKLIITSFFLMSLFACDKENTQPDLEYFNNIIAGKTEGICIKYSEMLTDTLFFYYPSSK